MDAEEAPAVAAAQPEPAADAAAQPEEGAAEAAAAADAVPPSPGGVAAAATAAALAGLAEAAAPPAPPAAPATPSPPKAKAAEACAAAPPVAAPSGMLLRDALADHCLLDSSAAPPPPPSDYPYMVRLSRARFRGARVPWPLRCTPACAPQRARGVRGVRAGAGCAPQPPAR